MSELIDQSAPIRKSRGDGAVVRDLAQLQAAFANAILDPGMAVPSGLTGPDGRPGARRFAVYRNNVVAGLIETLKAAFPVTCRLVGDEFFAAMARVYVAGEPPRSPIMLDYGAGFSEFIEQFEPAAALPYLRDIARLERSWVEAYHAAEAIPLPPSALARVPPVELPSMRLLLHPSVRIVRSIFPIVAIWQINVDACGTREVNLADGGEDALVTRPDAEVEVRALPVGAAAFIDALLAGSPIVDAMKRGLSVGPCFDLACALTGLFEARAIIGFDRPSHRPVRDA